METRGVKVNQMNKSLNRNRNNLNSAFFIRLFSIAIAALVFFFDANVLQGQDLLTPAADAPRYRLSNLSFESDNFGRQVLTFDYTRTQAGKMVPAPRIEVEGKTKSGVLRVVGVSVADASGKVKISTGLNIVSDVEIYFYINSSFGKMLVSNVARKGNPGTATRGKAWTPDQKKAYERSKLAKTPPKSIPSGYVAVKANANLLPGMPIKAGSFAEWVDATVIRTESKNRVLVQFASNAGLVLLNREKWLAIKAETLQQGKSNPDQFSTNIRVLPNSTLVIPDGADPLPEDLELPVGTPLKYDYGIRWRDVYVVKDDDGKIKLRYKGYKSNWDRTEPRSKFLITKKTLEQLKESDAAEKFASNIEAEEFPTGDSSPFSKRSVRVTEYPIKLTLPAKCQIVPEDVILEVGTPLAVCWSSKWNAVSVLHENSDGSVKIRFEGWNTEYNMKRSQLVIQNKTLKKLERKSDQEEGEKITGEQLAKTLRVWTDSTGEFKIEAYYISHTEKQVVLKTAADREIKMPFSKLSEADQKLLSNVVQKAKNPFE